jgi:NADH-quinone oxidoreductase subunit C
VIPENLQNNPIVSALGGLVTAANDAFGELTIEVAPDSILAALGKIKSDLKFERLTSVTGVDRFPAEPRFEVVYHLQSIAGKARLRLKARLPGDNHEIESATAVYRSADWYERETFDFFGIVFLNHPNLTRIMMPEGWEGYPLRKDYPVTGTRY